MGIKVTDPDTVETSKKLVAKTLRCLSPANNCVDQSIFESWMSVYNPMGDQGEEDHFFHLIIVNRPGHRTLACTVDYAPGTVENTDSESELQYFPCALRMFFVNGREDTTGFLNAKGSWWFSIPVAGKPQEQNLQFWTKALRNW